MDRRGIIIGGGVLAAGVGAAAYLTVSGMGSAPEYSDYLSPLRRPLANPADVRNLVRYATLAPFPIFRAGRPSSIPTTTICLSAWVPPPKILRWPPQRAAARAPSPSILSMAGRSLSLRL
jgi:hypothetical protein